MMRVWIVQSERRRFNNRNLFTTLDIHLRRVCAYSMKYHNIIDYYTNINSVGMCKCVILLRI